MRLTVHTFLTVDGVMQGPGGPDEDTTGGFTRGGWLVPFVDEDFGAIVDAWFARAEAILLGRTTYTMMYDYWSQITDPDNLVAAKLNGQPKYVASATLRDPGWQHTTVLSRDVIERVRELKQQPGDELQVHGSCGLAQALHQAGLVDEYRLLVAPGDDRRRQTPVHRGRPGQRIHAGGVQHHRPRCCLLGTSADVIRGRRIGVEDGREAV